jgi:hypothetical protein
MMLRLNKKPIDLKHLNVLAIVRCFAVFCCLIFSLEHAKAQNIPSTVRFSQSEIELLKKIDRIQRIAGSGQSLLAITPLALILTSLNPVDLLISIATDDSEKIAGGISSLQKIQACVVHQAIVEWRLDNEHSNTNSEAFFNAISQRADKGC